MNGLIKILLATCVLVQVVYAVYPLAPSNPQSLTSLFFRSRSAYQDPAKSMSCFSVYVVQSNEVSESYGKQWQKCFVVAKAGREAIETEMADKRISITKGSQNVCQRLKTCNDLNTTLDILNCHSKIGANNTKAVYSISRNASEYATVMHEKYRIIDLRHEQCCKLSERTYVETTAANYRTLQDCLEGRVTSTTTTTSTTTATSATSPEPTSTTTSGPETSSVASTTTTTTTQPSITTSEIPVETISGEPDVELPTVPALAVETEQFAKLLKLVK